MSPSIRSLRRGVATGGVALLVVLAAFLGIARLKGRRFGFDLPGRLGVDISQTANGFTYSQSQKGHTLFTIHASKLVQYKGDQAELHDVTITLYGPEGSGRSDKIYGSEFMYDRKQGLARADGAVRIDFSSPGGNPDAKPGSPVEKASAKQGDANAIHVLTSGVVFNQASGSATTGQRVDFVLARASGSAIGADYNAKDGVLVLDKQVALTTSGEGAGGAAATIRAEHAQLLRETREAYLIKADAVSDGRHTTSDQATITFRPDGSAQHIDARGHVRLVTEDGAEAHASDARIDLDAVSRPLVANLSGGVTYHADDGKQTMQGSAVSATLEFVAAPGPGVGAVKPSSRQQLHHARFRDAVTFVLQQHSLAGDPNGSATREMAASQIDIEFAPGAGGQSEAQHVLGVGGARVTLDDVPSKGVSKSTAVSGDQLLVTLANGRELKVLDGKGSTRIADRSSDGANSSSSGDTLHVTFATSGAAGQDARGASGGSAEVDTAVQEGNVVLLQAPAPNAGKDPKADSRADAGAKNAGPGPPSPFHATAQRAEYHSADEVLHLSGDPHLRNDSFAIAADRIDCHRDNGDAAAVGNVKATYAPQTGQSGPTLGGDGPVHIVADHAQLTRSSNTSIFYGTPATLARMWQAGDSVAAPVLELARDEQTLDAHGERGSHGAVVQAVLGSKAAAPAATGTEKPEASRKAGPSAAPTRLSSETLRYIDKEHRADLRGSVTAEQPAGTVHADLAQIYLSPVAPNKPSQLDHLIAAGHVVIVQPGRRGAGDRLVYTAADGRYVLTGSPGQPPRIVDAQKGTTTGAALIFKTADDSVEVSSRIDAAAGSAPGPPARTVTDTHTPN